MQIDYGKLSPVAIGAIKELIDKVEKLEKRVDGLTTENTSLRNEVMMLKSKQ